VEGTFEVDVTAWSKDLRLSADGEGIVAWAGAVPVRMLADRTGLTGGLSAVLARRGFDPLHDRGRVLTDVATAIACGARDLVDIEALRAQSEVFGPVASDTTARRTLDEIGGRGRFREGFGMCHIPLLTTCECTDQGPCRLGRVDLSSRRIVLDLISLISTDRPSEVGDGRAAEES
jgi:hypothetical protein